MEQSFGIIPVTKKGKTALVFLIQHQAGHWGFPKGHANPGEDPYEAAKRELFEETGLTIAKQLSDEILEETYEVHREGKSWKKSVQYYLCLVDRPLEIFIDKNEILEGKWIEIENAPAVLTFEEGRRICQRAIEILEKGV